MSAFFLSVNRNGSGFAPSQAQRMMSQLDRFGRDAKQLLVQDHYALGYQSLWMVPEEQGEQQPLFNQSTGDYLMFSGRIDNRETLIEILQLKDHYLSDAQLMMAFYQQHKTQIQDKLKAIIGPFVFVVFNPQSQHLFAARDAMGGRYLCCRLTDQHIHIATYEMAIVAHDSVDYVIDKHKAASALVVQMEHQPCSSIVGIEPLSPGHCLSLKDNTISNEVYYLPDPEKRIWLKDDDAYALEFRRLLDQAVARRLRSLSPIGAMLSGGLDSVPMSISATKILKKNHTKLTAFSWVFDKFPESDEREYSSNVCERFDIEQVCINCDEVWPQFDRDMHTNPIVPFGIPYSEYQQATMSEAQRRGVSVLLTGIYGDHLYLHSDSVFFELLRHGRWRLFAQEFMRFWGAAVSKKKFIKYFFVAQLPGVKKLRAWRQRWRPQPSINLLVDELLGQANSEAHWLANYSKAALRPEHYRGLLDASVGEDAAHGKYMEAKYNVERRYPFRDRELCEFMLAIPSDQLYFNLSLRPILKKAYQSELGDKLLNRNSKTSFLPVINAGISADSKSQQWFQREPKAWKKYVKERYFQDQNAPNNLANLVSWRCGYYSYWEAMCYNFHAQEMGKRQ